MDKTDYAQMFALTAEEQPLHILICADKRDKHQREASLHRSLPQAEFVDPIALPHLPFPDQSFDLVLCPNTLFVENSQQTESFIGEALAELIRVGGEVRVLPLVNQEGIPSEHLGSVIQALQAKGIGVELRQVQSAADSASAMAMLRLWNAECAVKQ